MVNPPLASLMINIKVLQVVVEINTSSTKVPSKQSSMSSEDGGYVDVSFSAEGNSETGLPFVEVSDNGCFGLSGRELLSAGVSWSKQVRIQGRGRV